jgi:hypothetical protein
VGSANAQVGRSVSFWRADPIWDSCILALIPYIFPKPADGDIGHWFPKSNRLAQIVVSVIGYCYYITLLSSLIP